MLTDDERSSSSASEDTETFNVEAEEKRKGHLHVNDHVRRGSSTRTRPVQEHQVERQHSTPVPHSSVRVPVQSSVPPQGPVPYIWNLVPENPSSSQYCNVPYSMAPPNVPGQWQFLPTPVHPHNVQIPGSEQNTMDDNSISKCQDVKKESLKRRERRAKKKQLVEEARRRVEAGMKPYAVQVRPSGIVDSGCRGHLKWQELVRDLTPRMLDMSVITYEDQDESSRQKLRDSLINKFEFEENEVTDASLDKMIKTWLRKDRERAKRLFAGTIKAPPRYNEREWVALKKHWNDPVTKEKSEKMSQTRKKVASNPRVGRCGYAGKAQKLVRSFCIVCQW